MEHRHGSGRPVGAPAGRSRGRISPFGALFVTFALCLATAGSAHADVVGRLHFSVKNAADEKPIAGAKITLHDTANVRADVTLTTDAQGGATTGQLDNRTWHVTTEAENSQPDTRDVTVIADTTSEVEMLLEPLKEQVIRITAARSLLN